MRDITCFDIKEGYYSISEYGEVYSKIYNKFLSYKVDKDGYHDVLLVCNDGKRRHFRIHRLVAGTYLDNPEGHPIVLHLDNNKQNNHYSNLKWGTISENTQQAYDDGCCSCNKEIYLYNRDPIYLIKRFNSLTDLAKYFGYSMGNVTALSKIASGEKPHPKSGKLVNFIISDKRL